MYIRGKGIKSKMSIQVPGHIGVSPDYLDTISQTHNTFSGLIELAVHNPWDHGEAKDSYVDLTPQGRLTMKDNGKGVPWDASNNPNEEKDKDDMFNLGNFGKSCGKQNAISQWGQGIWTSYPSLGEDAFVVSVAMEGDERDAFICVLLREYMKMKTNQIYSIEKPFRIFT